jgi:uncharacterized membrane protein SpoIIM required for sporulation
MRSAALPCFVFSALLVICGGAAGALLSSDPVPAPGAVLARPGAAVDRGMPLLGRGDLPLILRTNLAFGARLVLGTLTMGLYALYGLLRVGFDLGALAHRASHGMPAASVFWLIAPHGVLELLALALLGSLEFQVALAARAVLAARPPERAEVVALGRRLSRQAMLAFAALAVAALIEVFVTKGIHDLFI